MHLLLKKVDNYVEYVDNFILCMWKTLLKMRITFLQILWETAFRGVKAM